MCRVDAAACLQKCFKTKCERAQDRRGPRFRPAALPATGRQAHHQVSRQHHYRKVCAAAGIEFWFRDWRHHAATTWAKAGIPVQQGVRAMGRSSPAMLKVYVDLAERDVAALSARQPGKETATPRLNGYKTEGGKNPTL
jgi:hypothetical protein